MLDDDATGRTPISWASSAPVRRNMQANRGRDTGPELAVRRRLHGGGLRYRVNYRFPGARRRTIDIAFTRARIACFIDGCYWHQCPVHFVMPKTNRLFWAAKFEANVTRDLESTAALQAQGWTVLRFWEHEHPESIVRCIATAVANATLSSTL